MWHRASGRTSGTGSRWRHCSATDQRRPTALTRYLCCHNSSQEAAWRHSRHTPVARSSSRWLQFARQRESTSNGRCCMSAPCSRPPAVSKVAMVLRGRLIARAHGLLRSREARWVDISSEDVRRTIEIGQRCKVRIHGRAAPARRAETSAAALVSLAAAGGSQTFFSVLPQPRLLVPSPDADHGKAREVPRRGGRSVPALKHRRRQHLGQLSCGAEQRSGATGCMGWSPQQREGGTTAQRRRWRQAFARDGASASTSRRACSRIIGGMPCCTVSPP